MDDVTFILLGATGDLTKRKILPAIYRLVEEQKMTRFLIVGVARRENSMREIFQDAKQFVAKGKKAVWDKIQKASYYHQLDFTSKEDYAALKVLLDDLEKKNRFKGNRLFYLATLPDHFDAITDNIARTALAPKDGRRWSRLVYEKPFGYDLRSARKINRCIARVFAEDQVFRIDHYLGKELVGNIAILRFANQVLEPLWNHAHIDSVQIHFREKIGIEGRGNFYEKYGALKDVVQNHLLQMLALTAMEAPKKLTGNYIREEKARVLRHIIVKDLLLGQYEGYTQENGVRHDSPTETFAAVKLQIMNTRWRGVPFYLLTGKHLEKKETKIVIKFKPVHCRLTTSCPSDTNYLTIRVQPDEGFALQIFSKVPGKADAVMPAVMDYCHPCVRDIRSPEAYEILLEDVLKGDQSLFVRNDEIEYQWKVIERIQKHKRVVHSYQPGTYPIALQEFAQKHNMRWQL